MKVHSDIVQGSQAWLDLRAGVPTASGFDRLVTPKFEVRTGEMPKTYLAEKLAEWWLGPLPGHAGAASFAMGQGTILESEAIPWYELEFGGRIDRVGFITTDDGRAGCSPDGLIGKDCGIEIKCPEPTTHCKYLLAGVLPPDYAAQVHGSMFVTGRTTWKFLSYRRFMPPFIITVERDDEAQAALAEAIEEFSSKLAAAKTRLLELNGGIRHEPVKMVFADEYVPDENDVPTP